MSTTAAPFGLRPVFAAYGGSQGQMPRYNASGIASTYGSSLYQNSPVLLATTGVLNIGATTGAFMGSFVGCLYQPVGVVPQISNYWPASTTLATNTTAAAYYYDDPNLMYEMQSSGSLAQTSIGDQANMVNPTTGNTTTGLSNASISSTLATVGVQAQLRIVGLALESNNAWGDAYTNVQVMIAQHQFVYPQTAL